jgi:hypothetical protein
MSTIYWGYNYDYQTGKASYDNATVVGYVQKTPIVWIRLPLTDDGYGPGENWGALVSFCASTHCKEIVTVGGPGVSAKEAVAGMKRAVAYGLQPAYWSFGNEPDLWGDAGHPTSGLQYADLVKQWIDLAKVPFPDAKFLGAEITGHASLGDPYIYNVTKVDGSLISGMGIQLYPQFGYSTVAGFLKSLTVATSVGTGIPAVAALMKKACSTCSIPILLSEFQGGSGENSNYIPFREGFTEATFFGASVVQGLRVHLAQFMPWTLTGAPSGLTSHPGSCDMGLIELNTSCDGSTLSPAFYLYANLLTKFPYGSLTNVSDPLSASVYAVEVSNGTKTVALVVNANPATTEDLTLGSGFPTSGSLTTYLMDLEHVATPLTSSVTLTTHTQVEIPPLGIMLLSFSSKSGGGGSDYATTGRVESTNKVPISGAKVAYTVKGTPESVYTNGAGYFTASLPNGTFKLWVSALHYVAQYRNVTVDGKSAFAGHFALASVKTGASSASPANGSGSTLSAASTRFAPGPSGAVSLTLLLLGASALLGAGVAVVHRFLRLRRNVR